jgi:hypothetical protein
MAVPEDVTVVVAALGIARAGGCRKRTSRFGIISPKFNVREGTAMAENMLRLSANSAVSSCVALHLPVVRHKQIRLHGGRQSQHNNAPPPL